LDIFYDVEGTALASQSREQDWDAGAESVKWRVLLLMKPMIEVGRHG